MKLALALTSLVMTTGLSCTHGRAQLHVGMPPASDPRDSGAAEEDLSDLARQLGILANAALQASQEWPKDPRPWDQELRSLWSRLALFPIRHGVDARQLSAWPEVSRQARIALAAWPKSGTASTRFDRSMLLEWSGDDAGAQEVLESIRPDDWASDGCWTCRLENGVEHDWHRAALSARRGQTGLAVELTRNACLDLSDWLGIHFAHGAELLAWFGDLLARTDHTDAAVAVWRGVAAAHPGTPGALAAEQALETSPGRTPSRLSAVRLEFELHGPGEPESVRMLVLEQGGRSRVLAISTAEDGRGRTVTSLAGWDPRMPAELGRWRARKPTKIQGTSAISEAQREAFVQSLEPFAPG